MVVTAISFQLRTTSAALAAIGLHTSRATSVTDVSSRFMRFLPLTRRTFLVFSPSPVRCLRLSTAVDDGIGDPLAGRRILAEPERVQQLVNEQDLPASRLHRKLE